MLIQQALEHLLIHFVEMTVAHWCSHAFSDSGTSGLYFYEEADERGYCTVWMDGNENSWGRLSGDGEFREAREHSLSIVP